jgi:acyl-CoA thioester hydrolase
MAKADFVCISRLRVRWAEVDMQKIVFNGHYLTYIDTAVAEYWREIGLPYPEGYVERYGSDLFLRKATVEYLGSARYDEMLEIYSRVCKLGRSSMTFNFEIYRETRNGRETHNGREAHDAPLVSAELVYVNADPSAMKAAPLPDDVRSRVLAYERIAPAASSPSSSAAPA